MPRDFGKHLDLDDRFAIEEGICQGLGASEIGRRIGVSPSTVTREVKANRTSRPCRSRRVKPARKCGLYDSCRRERDVCGECLQEGRPGSRRRSCRMCDLAVCCDSCPDFVPRECALLGGWPYVCRCASAERARCDLPKWRYSARRADEAAAERRSSSRAGVSLGEGELAALLARVGPLIRQGLSIEAIWMSDPGGFPVSARTFRSWMERGAVEVPAILLPRKVRCRPRRPSAGPSRAEPARLDGRRRADFMALPAEERARAVEVDSVLGFASNASRALSVHFARICFQAYLKLPDASPASAVGAFDHLELGLGGPEGFSEAMGTVLLDRGEEFSDVEGLERSLLVPGARRCRVYFCDAMSPAQKGSCERNHAELRRILPKGRSDFDALTAADLALAASHVNSYPRRSLNGRCPIDLARMLLPEGFLEHLGVEKVPIEEVVLRPSLLAHAVEQ